MEQINSVLAGIVMPAILIISGLWFGIKLKFFYIIHPVQYFKDLKNSSSGNGISPFRALTQALAGTLGVGNMAGVATAITAGGSGSIFWMVISAFIGMSVKYCEVYLGVLHRRERNGEYTGGAMYYIKDILTKYLPKSASFFGGIFALLCIFNTLLTGNIVQMKSAADAVPSLPPLILGGIVAAIAFFICAGKNGNVSAVTSYLIPFLSLGYIIISLYIIFSNAERLPSVFENIFVSAFSLKSLGGGVGGYAVTKAIRFGVTRGIFSNEAGEGTSPSSHSAADTKSPHHQGCFGVFEVFADTVVLCTMTALVILLSDGVGKFDGIKLTVYAYSSLAGAFSGIFISLSIVLFAFATVICSMQYARVAIGFFSQKQKYLYLYFIFSAAATVFGTIINTDNMWQIADFTVSVMTALNTLCLIIAFPTVLNTLPDFKNNDKNIPHFGVK